MSSTRQANHHCAHHVGNNAGDPPNRVFERHRISVNLSRRWHKGNHPGLVLARRLKRKAAQVWLFATRFDVPATNNGSENAVRGYKLAAKISGCWRTLSTLQRHCRIRSYLTTARSHGRHPLAAIRDALTGNTRMPPHPA